MSSEERLSGGLRRSCSRGGPSTRLVRPLGGYGDESKASSNQTGVAGIAGAGDDWGGSSSGGRRVSGGTAGAGGGAAVHPDAGNATGVPDQGGNGGASGAGADPREDGG